jgi:MscS family membrane protein
VKARNLTASRRILDFLIKKCSNILMSALNDFLGLKIIGNSIRQLIVSGGILCVAAVFKAQIANILIAAARRLIKSTKNDLNGIVEIPLRKPLEYLVILFGFFIATRFLNLSGQPHNIRLYVAVFIRVAAILMISWFLFGFADSITERMSLIWGGSKTGPDHRIGPIISISAKIVICALAFVMVIQNLGYSASGLIAGLGLGGLAFALAAKDTLANFFGAVVVFADKPFVTGDFIKFGDTAGTVEQIGIRSTHVRTAENTLISVPNSILANSIIDNRSKSASRKYSGTIALSAGTASETLEQAVSALDSLVKGVEGVSATGASVRFAGFAVGALNLSIEYSLETTDDSAFLELQQRINFAVLAKLEELGIPFAGASPAPDQPQKPDKKPASPSSPFDFVV